jgi:hypothetical protein
MEEVKYAPELNGFAVFYSVVLEFRWSCAAADRIKILEEKAGPLETIK